VDEHVSGTFPGRYSTNYSTTKKAFCQGKTSKYWLKLAVYQVSVIRDPVKEWDPLNWILYLGTITGYRIPETGHTIDLSSLTFSAFQVKLKCPLPTE
jgi:hypothetical protein